MALLEDVVGGWTGGIIVGLGAAVFAPSIVPLAASVIRPAAKLVITAGLAISDGVSSLVGEASTQVNELVAEAKEARQTAASTFGNGHLAIARR
jgi:hypothetical protein